MKIVYDSNLIKLMNMFETLTQAKTKDIFMDSESVVFVVQEHELGKALGKHGSNVRRISEALNRKIKIVEFNPDVLEFVKNMLYPLRVNQIEEMDGVVTLEAADLKTRGYIIGRNASNLRALDEKVRRYFPIKEIKVM